MDLIIYQMMEFQVMHVANGNRAVEELTGTSVTESYLTISGDRNALPECSVVSVI